MKSWTLSNMWRMADEWTHVNRVLHTRHELRTTYKNLTFRVLVPQASVLVSLFSKFV